MRPGLLYMWPLTRYGDRTAIVFKDRRLTFFEADALINRLCNGLLSLGLEIGRKVAVLIDNGVESAAALIAIPRAGLVYVTLNARHSAREHADVLNDSEADALIVSERYIDELDPFLPSVASLKHTVVIGSPGPGRLTYEELTADRPETAPDIDVDEHRDLERIHYTSGTTGKPKGGVWTFRIGHNVLTSILMNLDRPIGPDDVNLNCGPLSHAAGLMFMVYYSRGATNIVLPRFDVAEVLETIERERVTTVLFVPTMLYRILSHPDLPRYDLSSVKRVWYGTAPIAPERLREGVRVFGNVFRQNYGMTEIPQPITYLGPEDHVTDGTEKQLKRLASAGKPAMGVELKVLDEEGNPVEPGRIGEIVLRSDKLMLEYWKKPEETAEAMRDGWLHTRDMAKIDEDGYVYIVDRKSDMIISGGFNVYPREVEDVLMAHPAVQEAAVIGVPDDVWGEAIKAVVLLKTGAEASAGELIEHCKANLAGYKKPRSVEFVRDIPKTLSGKINRRAVREPYWEGFDRRIH